MFIVACRVLCFEFVSKMMLISHCKALLYVYNLVLISSQEISQFYLLLPFSIPVQGARKWLHRAWRPTRFTPCKFCNSFVVFTRLVKLHKLKQYFKISSVLLSCKQFHLEAVVSVLTGKRKVIFSYYLLLTDKQNNIELLLTLTLLLLLLNTNMQKA